MALPTEKNPLLAVREASAIPNWSDDDYCIHKAYVCSLFSSFAYRIVPDFELQDRDRVKVVPCETYQALLDGRARLDYGELLRESDLGEYFTVIRRYAIVFGIKMPDFIIVAVRGTRYSYDWLDNLNSLKVSLERAGRECKFHRGFYRAAISVFGPLTKELRKYVPDSIPIYVTGHSLGGAIAAIIYALWGITLRLEPSDGGPLSQLRITCHSGYTFGMPRYGNLDTVSTFRTPYHMYNAQDIVPDVPPTWLGFENCFTEYLLDGTSLERAPRKGGREFLSWVSRLVAGQGLKEHSVEVYQSRIENHIKMKGG